MAIEVEAVYRKFGPMVLRRCRKLLGDESEALDATQDTFVQLLRAGERLHGEAISSLVYRVATNVCLNHIRSRKRRPAAPVDDLVAEIAGLDQPELRVLSRLGLRRLFAQEHESSAVIAVLHLCDGLTLEEVAEATGMSISGVRKRLQRLKKRLKETAPEHA